MHQNSDITLEINLSAIRTNYLKLKNLASNAVCCAVVKANCYGVGIKNVVPTLLEAGCKNFFVATLGEALELRKITHENIFVFHGIKKGEEQEFENHNLIPVLNDFYQLEVWSDFAKPKKTHQNAVLHFDTGMNRLGFDYFEAEKVKNSELIKPLNIKYVMSHLSCVSVTEHELNNIQLERTKKIKNIFAETPISLSNSRGILAGNDYHFDMVRPGAYLYGVSGTSGLFKSETVVTLKAKILQIRDIKEEGLIGYCGASIAKRGMRIAVTPLGYADGYMRCLTGNSHSYYKNYKLPLLGRVSMDMTIWDISKVPENEINVGNEIELMGENITVDELATRAQTIGYEILTGLGRRYKINIHR